MKDIIINRGPFIILMATAVVVGCTTFMAGSKEVGEVSETTAILEKVYDDGTMDILLTTEGDPNDPNRVEFEDWDPNVVAGVTISSRKWHCPKHGENDYWIQTPWTFDGTTSLCPICVGEVATKLLIKHGVHEIKETK